MQLDIAPVLLALAHVALGVVALIIAKLLKDWLSPYGVDRELTSRDNPAFGLAIAGYYAAVVIIFIGAARSAGPLPLDAGSTAAIQALGIDLAWAVVGTLALNVSRTVMDRLLVASCCQSAEVIGKQNTAAGAVEGCVYIATGLVIAGSIRQVGGTVATTAAFFVLSQLTLLLFGRLYQRLAGYNAAHEIQSANLAAGVPLGMTLVAIALLMMKATSGEFVDWITNLSYFAFDAVAGFPLLLALRWLADLALLPNARIADEIVRDRNVSVGLVEGTLAVGIAAIVLFVF
ncbi:MAG: DUF350 domain-containing protein [Bryobacteraceae bacterium]|nr:DUF350 domain-containing protein [Bryobacteraceae bacterium]